MPKNSNDTILPKIDSLKAVIITATTRPKIKGDTLEYNTENIVLRPNTMVEQLLMRLPGLRIDAAGNITYNGEKIDHLLVDGQDIFGSDPTMVTRNFDASKIARVQLLDRRTDRAIFTGIDDGTRVKTLNLVLKESARNGYFGRVEAGGDVTGYYNANGALAGFRGKEQVTALGITSNTGITGFSSDAGGSASNLSFVSANADLLGASAGTGIPKFDALALHYADIWGRLQNNFSGNYQYGHLTTQPITTIQTLQALHDSLYGQHQQNQSLNTQDQHWIYATYDLPINAKSALRFEVNGKTVQGSNRFNATDSSTFNDTLVNGGRRHIQDQVGQQIILGNAGWRTQLGSNPARIFSMNAGLSKIVSSTNGYLYSLNQYYQPNGSLLNADTIDERKQLENRYWAFNGFASYAEPLWSNGVLGFSYGLSLEGQQSRQNTFDRGDGKYQTIVDSLSSQIQSQSMGQRLAISLQGSAGHLSYVIGSDGVEFSYRQHDLIADSTMHLHYYSWTPRAMFSYTPSPATSLRLNYYAAYDPPSIAQLQPIKNNSDPLHIMVGNPALKPSYAHNVWLDFRRMKAWMVNLSVNLGVTSNSISNRTTTDSLGRQISQPVNVNGGLSTGFNLSINKKVLGLDAGFSGFGTYSRTNNYVNADLSRNDLYIGGGGFNINKFAAEKFMFQLSSTLSYFYQQSSVDAAAPIHYWTQSYQGNVSIYLIKGFDLGTNAGYTWQQKSSAFAPNTSVFLWNGYVSRNLLKNRLTAKFQISNILDVKNGISRTNVNNVNTSTSTNILGRYWMISAVYHFDKKFKQK